MEQIVDYISKLTMSDKLIISELQAKLIPDADFIGCDRWIVIVIGTIIIIVLLLIT